MFLSVKRIENLLKKSQSRSESDFCNLDRAFEQAIETSNIEELQLLLNEVSEHFSKVKKYTNFSPRSGGDIA